ncbi:8-amino-7-oxononanoate synthase [Thermoflavifilum aggregans]|uniref:8-amino-7-oxononanoate synthase n=1 Tax=Thermoflavifilum aggregans TaxID=454188 RepID=A0A2M9CUV6_9BACT|nr:8-amino-7-oxononanoate synthase [Thermoflavifilum aggregans]PJJ75669.1 8-amino-7-oxononanoate synthase [Thermoflavifilum aggregans]
MYTAYLERFLAEKKAQQAYRELRLAEGIDFCSNDYLGLARDKDFQQHITEWIAAHHLGHGSTGSRLLSGAYALLDEVEQYIAQFHQTPAALIFSSGYMANLALMSAIPQRGDLVLYDQLIHASLRDGLRMSFARHRAFAHNDLHQLEELLQKERAHHPHQRIFVVAESIYSMDGDQPDLVQLTSICEQYEAALLIDEAHAVGVIGPKGEGLVQFMGVTEKCFARVVTFGKALGAHGAAILGSELLRQYLINTARPLIYSTALPPASLAAVYLAYQQIPEMHEQRRYLQHLAACWQQQMQVHSQRFSPIQIVRIPGNARVKACAQQLQAAGFDVRPILHPTVPAGEERLRIVLHSFNTEQEVMALTQKLNEWLNAEHQEDAGKR